MKKHIIVAFLFTQSGIKPLTSAKMSKRYADMSNKFKKSDIICVCGFAFNCDDEHINYLFRELIEDYNKDLSQASEFFNLNIGKRLVLIHFYH